VALRCGENLEASPGGKSMIIEMRTYKTKPGMRSKFIETFRAKSIPAHASSTKVSFGSANWRTS
jgi:hypothetical protein